MDTARVHGKKMPRKKGMFTLIELLVVISIIAILAAMLLPALNKAKKTARSIACVNKLKQLSLYAVLYQDAYNEYFPWESFGQSSNPRVLTWSILLKYTASKNLSLQSIYNNCVACTTPEAYIQSLTKGFWKGFICPESNFVWSVGANVESWKYWSTSYLSNYFIGGANGSGTLKAAPARIKEIKKPSKSIYLCDGVINSYGTFASSTSHYSGLKSLAATGQWQSRVGYCHNGNANILFTDGHVSSSRQIRGSDFATSTGPSGTTYLYQ